MRADQTQHLIVRGGQVLEPGADGDAGRAPGEEGGRDRAQLSHAAQL
jgi:hypothetical protein